MLRRLQMTEDKHKSRGGGGGGNDAIGDLNDHYLFLGVGRTLGNVCVSPSLTEWVGIELQKESSILKERCKAREER
eukprot:2440065-Heterocapsa_arctica.AAC.1